MMYVWIRAIRHRSQKLFLTLEARDWLIRSLISNMRWNFLMSFLIFCKRKSFVCHQKKKQEKLRDISFETIGQSKARKIRTPPEPLIHGANQKDCSSRGHEKTFNKEQSLHLCSSLFRKWTLKSLLLHEGNKVFGTNTRYKDWPPGPSTFISSSERRLGGLGLHRSWQNWSKAWRWRSLPWNDQI